MPRTVAPEKYLEVNVQLTQLFLMPHQTKCWVVKGAFSCRRAAKNVILHLHVRKLNTNRKIIPAGEPGVVGATYDIYIFHTEQRESTPHHRMVVVMPGAEGIAIFRTSRRSAPPFGRAELISHPMQISTTSDCLCQVTTSTLAHGQRASHSIFVMDKAPLNINNLVHTCCLLPRSP